MRSVSLLPPQERPQSRAADFRCSDNQGGGGGVLAERGTLAGANEERAHGNNHLITCLTRSGGRQCACDWLR